VANLRLDPAIVPSIICPIHNPEGVKVEPDGNVPDVGGFSTIDAVSMLESTGYQASVTWDLSAPQLFGTVAGQSPAAGTPAPPGSRVVVVIAGPEPGTIIPGVVGLHRYDAAAGLASLGQDVRIVVLAQADHTDPEPGIVWSQAPMAGAGVTGTVTLWVNP
jgi:beta-lactam-binding protein with PASTA domain